MVSKSKLGQTNKYSNVVKGVQGAKQQPMQAPKAPEEPKITRQQVVEAFQSFGFTPNDRNHNDILYWTSKGQSEAPKMIDELHKRRVEMNKAEDDKKRSDEERQRSIKDFQAKRELAEKEVQHKQEVGKKAMPRLSDQDINDLFDEYGLPPPDPEWARNHLPNDPAKVRSILEMQRKTADDMLKKHGKNAVNAVPETPKMGAMPGMPPVPMAPGGMGGPMGMQGDLTMGSGEPVNPFFVGDHALVRITNPSNPQAATLWLVDSKKKVLRPIVSQKALDNAVEDPEEALRNIVTLSTKELGPGGALDGFKPLKSDMGVQMDGSMKNIRFTDAQLQNRYGQKPNPAGESKALSIMDGLIGQMSGKAPQQGGMPPM